MKIITFFLSLIIALVYTGSKTDKINQSQLVNPIVGNTSFVEKFGHQPNATTDEQLRVQTHLEYAEKLLRQKDISHLSSNLKRNRMHLLSLLHQYRVAGIFPRNYDYQKERKPCFIDKENRICAVGYLIEQTAGRKVAEAINTKFKYDAVLAMNDKTVDSWIANSGLTKEECAIIQPTYGYYPPIITNANNYNNITPAYGISSSIISGINLSANAMNGIQILKGTNHKAVAILSLITGTGQTVLGITNFPKSTSDQYNRNITNESQKTLSMINIGLGTSTMIFSVWNLITNKKPKDKKITWNVNGFQTPENNTGIAFSIKSKL